MKLVPQAIWRWQIAAYLFFAGVGGGAFIVGVVSSHLGYAISGKIAMTFGVPVVAFSTLFLITDLGSPSKFFKAIRHPQTSWISRGVLVLSGLIGFGGLMVALTVWPFAGVLRPGDGSYRVLESIAFLFAVATCTYTGILIGVVISRPFWNNPLLPLLFLISALSTGIGGLFVVTPIVSSWLHLPSVPPARLDYADLVLIALEAIAIYLYLTITSDRAPDSVDLLLRGQLARLFWGGFLLVGLALPALFEYFAAILPQGGSQTFATFLAGVTLLIGGFLMRLLLLAAGIRAPLTVRATFRVRPGN